MAIHALLTDEFLGRLSSLIAMACGGETRPEARSTQDFVPPLEAVERHEYLRKIDGRICRLAQRREDRHLLVMKHEPRTGMRTFAVCKF